jgi:hypothetical protein
MQPTNKPPFKAIRKVLNYLWHDEEMDYVPPCPNHIFLSLRAIRRWLDACGEDRELPSERWYAAVFETHEERCKHTKGKTK